jgi:hypothetical protein
MFQWMLNILERHDRKITIYDRDGVDPYLTRYYLRYPDGDNRTSGLRDIPGNTFLHQFMRSDDDVFHTHPWDYYHTVILKGGYWAHTPWGTKWCGVGTMKYMNCLQYKEFDPGGYSKDILLLPANLHWVEVPKPGQTWTLFSRGRKINDGFWGFWPDQTKPEIIRHDLYLEQERRKKDDRRSEQPLHANGRRDI